MQHKQLRVYLSFFCQVYHVSRNTWFRMETRVVKNVCAPAVVIGDQIIIVGGKGSVSTSLLPTPAQLLWAFAAFLLGVLPQKSHGAWEGKEECVHLPHTSLTGSHGHGSGDKLSVRHLLTPSSRTWVERNWGKANASYCYAEERKKPRPWGSCSSPSNSQPGPP